MRIDDELTPAEADEVQRELRLLKAKVERTRALAVYRPPSAKAGGGEDETRRRKVVRKGMLPPGFLALVPDPAA